MPLDSLLLVVLAAAIHVGWNAVARAGGGRIAFAWWTAVIGVAALAPWAAWTCWSSPGSASGGGFWTGRLAGLVALSALFEACYFLSLQAAYRHTDLSVVYPLSRGIAPMVALLPGWFWSGDVASGRELAALALVLVGAILLARDGTRANPGRRQGLLFVVQTAAALAAYHVVDRRAMQEVPPPPVALYLFLMQCLLVLLLTPFALRTAAARVECWTVGRVGWRRLLAAGLAIQVAYALVLVALQHSPAASVTAARTGGIPISLLVGRLVLHEPVGARRWFAAGLIVGGVLLLIEQVGA